MTAHTDDVKSIMAAHDIRIPAPARATDEIVEGNGQTLIYAASEEPFAFVPKTDAAELEDMVSGARGAFDSGPWRKMPASERADILRNISRLILENADELANLQVLETSIPISQVRGMHVPRTAENFSFFADILSGLSGETYDQTGKYLSIVTREPVGVGVLIAPWNAPLILSSMKLAAGIALGNSMIVKPSEYAPLAILRLAELISEAGVPEGVVQVACGDGLNVGRPLVRHPKVDVVGFIGGTETGKHIMADAAQTIKKVGLELGGKSANIILNSANLELAIDGSLLAIFSGNGEQCLAGSRILVEDGIADSFIEAFVERTKNLRIGDAFDPKTEIGPMAFKAHYDRLLGFGATAKQDDYIIHTGAEAVAGFDKGYYFAPTVIEASSNLSELCQAECFGPFVTIQRIRDLDDGLARANESDFGLVSYVWSDDLPSIMKAQRELQAGTVWVNTPMIRDLRSPFGGYKQSGIGRDGLPGSIELFTEEKCTIIPQDLAPLNKIGSI